MVKPVVLDRWNEEEQCMVYIGPPKVVKDTKNSVNKKIWRSLTQKMKNKYYKDCKKEESRSLLDWYISSFKELKEHKQSISPGSSMGCCALCGRDIGNKEMYDLVTVRTGDIPRSHITCVQCDKKHDGSPIDILDNKCHWCKWEVRLTHHIKDREE